MTRVVVASDAAAVRDELAAATEAHEPVIVLVGAGGAGRVAELLAAGVRGVLPRDGPPEELAAAVRAVEAGLLVIHPDLAGATFHIPPTADDGRPRGVAPVHTLTPREREVLTMLADGLGNKVIAARLGISDHTVKAHVSGIFEKLRVSTRAEAAALGLRLGLIAL